MLPLFGSEPLLISASLCNRFNSAEQAHMFVPPSSSFLPPFVSLSLAQAHAFPSLPSLRRQSQVQNHREEAGQSSPHLLPHCQTSTTTEGSFELELELNRFLSFSSLIVQMQDFMKLYSGLVERCFNNCVNDFTSKVLTGKEVRPARGRRRRKVQRRDQADLSSFPFFVVFGS